jgi:hypothetical protein
MFDLLLASQNIPFATALAVMLGIAVLEGITTVFGMGLSHILETLIPHLEFDFDIDVADTDIHGGAPLSSLLGWLHFGKVPVLMLLVIFLTGFGLSGLFIQSMVKQMTGTFLPAVVASIPAIICALPVMRIFGSVLTKILPQDETDAVSEDALIGRIATITMGKAEKGSPAEAKVRDQHRYTHYVMVEPDKAGIVFNAGEKLLLVGRKSAVYHAIMNPNPILTDTEET